MLQFSDVKSQSARPESFIFKWIFDMLNINMSFDSKVYDKRQKKRLNEFTNEDLNLKVAIAKIVGWKVFNFGLSFSIVDSLCRFVIFTITS